MPVGVQDIHVQSLATSSALSEYYVANLITPLEVIRILNTAKVRFMLLGAHGIGGWTQTPRPLKTWTFSWRRAGTRRRSAHF